MHKETDLPAFFSLKSVARQKFRHWDLPWQVRSTMPIWRAKLKIRCQNVDMETSFNRLNGEFFFPYIEGQDIFTKHAKVVKGCLLLRAAIEDLSSINFYICQLNHELLFSIIKIFCCHSANVNAYEDFPTITWTLELKHVFTYTKKLKVVI